MFGFKKLQTVFHKSISNHIKNNFFYVTIKAHAGNADAQFKIGFLHQYGNGFFLDCDKAIIWYRKAAEQNHKEAQFKLGLMYEDGIDIKQDEQQAIYWYEKAAVQGYVTAQISLAFLLYHRKADGDLAMAYSWLAVAASLDSNIIKDRNTLLTLTPLAQREKAQVLAQSYIEKYGKK